MNRKCSACGTVFSQSEIDKLGLAFAAYKDKSTFTNCNGCGRSFVAHWLFCLLYVIVIFSGGIYTAYLAFFVKQTFDVFFMGLFFVVLSIFKKKIHQHFPIVDVSDTDLLEKD